METISIERDGHVLLIGLNRPEKRNAFTQAMLAELSRARVQLESDESLRAGVLFAHGIYPFGGGDAAVPERGRLGQCDALDPDRRRVRHRRGAPHRVGAGGRD